MQCDYDCLDSLMANMIIAVINRIMNDYQCIWVLDYYYYYYYCYDQQSVSCCCYWGTITAVAREKELLSRMVIDITMLSSA